MTRSIRSRHLWPALASGAFAVASGAPAAHAQTAAGPAGAGVASMSLGEVVALAKERAPAVHAALARVASAEAGVEHASAARLPSLYVQGSGTAYATNGQVYSSGVTSSTSGEWYAIGSGALNLQWTLYDFGHTGSSVDAARSGVDASKLSARAMEQTAMAEAAVAFFTLLADDDLVHAAEAAQADRERVAAITHHLVEAGYRPPLDETRAQIEVDVAKLERARAAAARDTDSVTLATALLLDPATTFHLEAPAPLAVDDQAAARGTLDVKRRRDVAAAAARVEQASRGLDAAKYARLPVLGLSASGQILYSHDVSTYQNPAPPPTYVTSTTNGPSELAQGVLTLTVPIFDAMIGANIHTAEAGLAEARADLDQISATARSETVQAAHQARDARALLDQSEHLATGTKANLTAVEDRYTNGMEGPLVLADAQREDAAARVAIVRARLAYDVAAVRLLAGVSRADELLKAR